jgi:hypothetical protein
MKSLRLIPWGLLFIILILPGCTGETGSVNSLSTTPPATETAAINYAPDFLIFNDTSSFTLSAHRGKVVILGFWSSSDTTYYSSLRLYQQLAGNKDLDVVLIQIPNDRLVAQLPRGITIPSFTDDRFSVQQLFRIANPQATVVINADGSLRSKHEGQFQTLADLVAFVGK